MNHPKEKTPRCRYRLNVKKFSVAILMLSCVAVFIIIAANSVEHAAEAAVVATENVNSSLSLSPEHSAKGSDFPKAEGLLILVNWDNPAPFDRPDNLVTLSEVFGDEVICVNPEGSINAEAGAAAKEMFLAAGADGIGKYELSSAYRSIEYQDKLWQARIAEDPDYGSDPYKNPVKVMPGRLSEHTTGLALDILSERYELADDGYTDTPEGMWLAENAYRYGFILRYPRNNESITGVIFEPWHYRYVGKEAAQAIFERGICLEEYLGVAG